MPAGLPRSLAVTVEDGKIRAVRGSHANPFTGGVICNKVARNYPGFVHGPNRLTQPLRRSGPRGSGQFEPISWDTALDLIHEGFSRAINAHGGQSVLPLNYAGPHGELAAASLDRRFFYRMGATRLNRGPLCAGVRSAAYASLFGTAPGMSAPQVLHSDLVLIWGNNVTVSYLHLAPLLKQARKAGAKVVVIDPKRTKIAEQADLHLQLVPGTDVVLAMALAAELERRDALDPAFIAEWTTGADQYLEAARSYTPAQAVADCGLQRTQFDQLADWIAAAGTMATAVGNGIERGRSGGSGLRAAMALQALTGQHGRIGAGVLAKPSLAAPKTPDRLQGSDSIDPQTRVINILDVAAKMLDPDMRIPIRAVMIYNHNPVATHPDQARLIKALSQEEIFVAGSDVVMTDSMRLCDVILPASSHFECDDIYGAYGQTYLQRAAPVIPPVGDSLPNTEIFRRLAARFGYDAPEFHLSDAELMDLALDATSPALEGMRPRDLPLDRAIEVRAPDGGDFVLCDTVMPGTASGRIELFSADLEAESGFGLPRYDPVTPDRAFVLMTPASANRTNATFGDQPLSEGPEPVEIHPEDARRLGLSEGDRVELFNDQATVGLVARITDATRPGVLYSPKGSWRKSSPTGLTVNALIPVGLRTDIADGACYNETFVDLRKGPDGHPAAAGHRN
ncbi:molybdopterin-dependent oxidoreductase [Phaeobacter sp.]|uniref:molybdopterin-containing oxidoreductase family protein n=1 Tax=Phaeobacter sp. TaxID=1902409 RepID=UPI0025E44078|nr:molybdopterin-dependent oxidoreductase [Phaeobacter sp.]